MSWGELMAENVRLRADVACLTEALAAAEHRRVQALRLCDEREAALKAAEQKLAEAERSRDELFAEIEQYRDGQIAAEGGGGWSELGWVLGCWAPDRAGAWIDATQKQIHER